MLGYMTKEQALKDGFTHHGSYYGIPLWLAVDGPEGMMVATKWAPMEYVMTAFTAIEQLMFPLVHGADAEPCFQFGIGPKIV